ncbi:hypothetical protein HY989_04085 [Candidatus Micrarchaeota archaeon]|nr:hypothetical protein [Candidatus Micrarchaeota archaeon]
MAKGRRRVLKVCPDCGSSEVKPAKEVDEWASIEEQMSSASSGSKFECMECGYKGELIGVEEAPEDDEEPVDSDSEIPKIELQETKEEKEERKKEEKAKKAQKSKGLPAKKNIPKKVAKKAAKKKK